MVGGKLTRKAVTTQTMSLMTPPPSATTPSNCRWSWSSESPTEVLSPVEKQDILSPDDEVERLEKARARLIQRQFELSRIIRHANDSMDLVRRKLCKDLQLLEILKEEIDKAGTGPIRDQLEEDFHDGIQNSFPALLWDGVANVGRIYCVCSYVDDAEGPGRGNAAAKEGCCERDRGD